MFTVLHLKVEYLCFSSLVHLHKLQYKNLKIDRLQMFNWLVGETEVWSTDIMGPDGRMREQRSVLHIKKCRFLEAVSINMFQAQIQYMLACFIDLIPGG